MKITINDGRAFRFSLPLPNSLVMNRMTAGFAAAVMQQKGVPATPRQLLRLYQAVRTYSTTHPDWRFVEVQIRDGATLEIRI